jgi:hypothetical protein
MSSVVNMICERIFVSKKVLWLSLVFSVAIGSYSSNAAARCAQFPNSDLATPLTHERAKKYVAKKLKGDWTPYISHLEKQLKSVNTIVRQGKTARIKRKGENVVLTSEQLSEYLSMSEARLEVVRCLASERRNMKSATAYKLPVTDSDEDPVMEVQPRAAVASAGRMKLEVSTVCSNGVSQFRVKNQGSDWSAAGAFSIYRIEDNNKYRVSSRRMRLKNGQVVSFTVKKSHNPSGNLGLFVDPGWYARPFNYDATLTCQ